MSKTKMDMSAMESMFDPEVATSTLLDRVRANVANSVKTVEAASSLIDKLSEEAAQFNDCLTTMANAIRKCEQGDMSREEMIAEIQPAVTALKEKCTALKLADVETDGDDITENEIAMLREYIVGCKDIVIDRMNELQDSATEGVSEMDFDNTMIATEGNNVFAQLRNSTDAKTAKEMYKQAKKLYGIGSKDKAKEYLAKAKKLYEKLLKETEKHSKMKDVKRTVQGIGYTDTFDTKTTTVTSTSAYALIAYFEDRIDSCTALLMQWDNKAGNKTFAETKAAMRLERSKTRAAKRARAAAEKDAKKFAKHYKDPEEEINDEAVESLMEIYAATEALLDEMDLEESLAMESEGEDAPASDPRTDRLRELAVQMKKAQASGDIDTAAKAQREFDKLLDELSKEVYDAHTEEERKAANRKAIKIGAIVAGLVAVAGGTAYGIKSGKFKSVAENLKAMTERARAKKSEDSDGTQEKKSAVDIVSKAKSAFSSIKGFFGKIFKKKATTEEPAGESYIDDETAEMIVSLESYLDDLEIELAVDCAMESEGADGDGEKSASSLGSKIRGLFNKLKGAKNKQEVEDIQEDIETAAEELEDLAEDAKTPEEKKKISTAGKIAIGAAGAAVLAVAGTGVTYGLGKALKSKAESKGDIKGIKKAIIGASDAIGKVLADGKAAIDLTVEELQRKKAEKKKAKPAGESFGAEGILEQLAMGFESDVDVEDDDFDAVLEAEVAIMLAEDGFDDEI